MPRARGLVIGCGGTLGFAWTAIALQRVEQELGWDARDAEVLVGTSAGAEMVALLGSGRSTDRLVDVLRGDGDDALLAHHLAQTPGPLPPVPALGFPARKLISAGLAGRVDALTMALGALPRGRGDAGWLRELGHALADDSGWVDHPATWIVAADAVTGDRVAFGSPDARNASLGDAIAASWAIPGWFAPAVIDGRRYVDGGSVSTASADLVAPLELDEVVVIAPMANAVPSAGRGLERAERFVRRRMTAGLDRELDTLRALGTTVVRIEPSPADLRTMGFNFMDHRRRTAVVETALRTTPQVVGAALTQGAAR